MYRFVSVDKSRTRKARDKTTYRVGSVNFSRRKIGHAHDNSADYENVAGAPQPNVHAHIIFRFEKRSGKSEHFSIPGQNTAETSQLQAQPTDD